MPAVPTGLGGVPDCAAGSVAYPDSRPRQTTNRNIFMTRKNIMAALAALLAAAAQPASAAQAEEQDSCYLFAFFSSNSANGEQIRYALSDDGLNYTSLNGGRPVVASDTIALKKSIRDPYICRGRDGKTYYMVMTDMRSGEGWQSNDGLILMKSDDLLHWQHTAIDFPTRFPGMDGFDRKNLHAVWAPQIIWDDSAGKYMIYYSIGRHDWEYPVGDKRQPHFKLFYSYVNDDFTDITEPQMLFDFGTAAIDGDIIYDDKNKEYVLFFKDEGLPTVNNGFKTRQGVMRATAKKLTGPYAVEYRHLQKPGQYPVEGSSVFRLIGSDDYILMYDCYAQGFYQFCRSSDLKNFTFVQNTPTRGAFTPRHGSVMHISAGERERLEAWSELATAIRDLEQRPAPTLTLKQLDARRELLGEARRTLAGTADPKRLRNMAARVNKF